MPELHPHQAEAVEKMHNGCILVGDVGTGKSITTMAYYMQKEAPKDVYIITTAKKRDSLDWEGEGAKYGIGTRSDATVAGILKVDSWNNIDKYSEVEGAFFIFDEQRLVGSGSWSKAFLRIAKRNNWVLLSATPGDTWLDYIPVFVANGFYKNRTEFLNTHVVYNRFAKFPKVERYIGISKLLRLKDKLLVEMPYDRHTIRHTLEVPVEYDQELFKQIWEKRWHPFESRPLRDVAELFLVARKAVNSDSSRLEAVRQLLLVHPRLIVFYNFNYELEQLRCLNEPTPTPASIVSSSASSSSSITGSASAATPPSTRPGSVRTTGTTTSTTTSGSGSDIAIATTKKRSSFSLAEWNGHKHEPIPTTERWVYLVQYTAGSEGWNCIETNAMCYYSLTYSYKAWHQSSGRIDRLNTPFTNLYYYVLMSDSLIDKAIMRALKAKKSFNENRLVPRF